MKLNRKEWTIFCFQSGLLLSQNFLLQDVLEIISKSRTRKRVKLFSSQIREEMQKGYALHEAMRNVGTKIAPYLVASVTAGEQSSSLSSVFQNLYQYFEGKNQLEYRLKSTSAYPLLVLTVSILLAFGLMSFIIPLIKEIVEVLAVEMPSSTKKLLNTIEWVSTYRWYLVIGITAFIGFVIYLCLRFKYFIHRMILHLPYIGEWIKKNELWKFFSTFSLMLKNHVSTDLALSISSETLSNHRLCEEIALAIEPLRQGHSLSGSLERFMISSEYFYSLLKTGEESNRMGQNIQLISEALQKELHMFYDLWVKLTEPLLFLSIGAIVFWIVFTTYLPMLSMFQWDMMGIP